MLESKHEFLSKICKYFFEKGIRNLKKILAVGKVVIGEYLSHIVTHVITFCNSQQDPRVGDMCFEMNDIL